MSRQLKFRTWLGKRFWFFDISTGFNNENKDVCNEPEQFTGLLDKNGKEIFEGDLVDVSGLIYSIIFENGCFQLFDKDSQHGRNPLCLERCKFITVIGDIHTTPELLK